MDAKTVLLVFDPSAPNVFGYDFIGDDVLLGPLRRPFWIELQARYGNLFFVRDNVWCPALFLSVFCNCCFSGPRRLCGMALNRACRVPLA
jgi:hypothetical protein